MSDPGRNELAKKQPRKKKEEISTKVAAGKSPVFKKGKRRSLETEESNNGPASPKNEEPPVVEQGPSLKEELMESEKAAQREKEAAPEPVPPPEVAPPKPEEVKAAEAKAFVEEEKKAEVTTKVQDVLKTVEEVKKKLEETANGHDEPPEVRPPVQFTSPRPPQPKAQGNIKKECLYKILVIGELGTGKTSIIKRYVHQFFSQHYRATIGVDFALKVLNWDQNTIIRLQLWDIAGQERFGNMTRVYYKEAVGAFIVFDVTRTSTFDAVVKWKQDLDAKVQLPDGSPIPCVLLANKCDQQKEGIVNNPNKMNEYCEEHKFSAWFETSAKENINIEEAAKALVDQIVRNDSSNENGRGGSRDTSKFPLESTEEFSESKSCAC